LPPEDNRRARPSSTGFEQTQGAGLGDFERPDHAFGEALPAQRVGISIEKGSKPAELFDQRLGFFLGVTPGDREGQQIFDQLVIQQCPCSAFEQALPKARAVTG